MQLYHSLVSAQDWEVRYQILIEAGRAIPQVEEAYRTSKNRVDGCTASTWILVSTDAKNRMVLTGYSKSHIVQGLIALLRDMLYEKTPEQIQNLTLNDFADLHLEDLITPTRQNGFHAILNKIKQYMKEHESR